MVSYYIKKFSGGDCSIKKLENKHREEKEALEQEINTIKEEFEWIKKNLLNITSRVERQNMIDFSNKNISIKRQCELLDLNRSSIYYKPRAVPYIEIRIKNRIDEIYTEFPYYG